jgi:hypothetical protein
LTGKKSQSSFEFAGVDEEALLLKCARAGMALAGVFAHDEPWSNF